MEGIGGGIELGLADEIDVGSRSRMEARIGVR